MKTPFITILSIVGVIATAGAAMAINSDALTTVSNQTIGDATEVLVPVDNYSVLPDPSASPTATAAPKTPDVTPPATSAEPVEPAEPSAPAASPAPAKPKPTSSPTASSPTPTPTRTPHDDGHDDDEHDD